MKCQYDTWDDETQEFTRVYELEDCLKAIRVRDQDNERQIARLIEENKLLKEECYRDEEIQKMQEEMAKITQDLHRGFPITEKENHAIIEWMHNHNNETHSGSYGGTIGGRYSYIFTPTSIGTVASVKCVCGEEFTFCDL